MKQTNYKAETLYRKELCLLCNYYVKISNKIAFNILLALVYELYAVCVCISVGHKAGPCTATFLYAVGKRPLTISQTTSWNVQHNCLSSCWFTNRARFNKRIMFSNFNSHLQGATTHVCTRPTTYSLVVPALPLMATKAVEQLVSDKQVVSLGGAHYRTLLPWCCRIIHAFAHPHPGMLNSCQILHQSESHCMGTNTLLLYCFSVYGIF
jgi:hypothetical protein